MTDAVTPITADLTNPATFGQQATLAWEQLITAIPQMNTAFAALNLVSVSDTSATSNTIDTSGDKTFTVSSGKSFLPGQYLTVADTAAPTTNSMLSQVVSYSGTSLVVTPLFVRGSGTKTAWTITLSAHPPQGLNGSSKFYAHTGNGHGSSNSKFRRLSTVVENTGEGADWNYTDSASNGGKIAFLRPGLYSITYCDKVPSTGDDYGVSKNSSQGTTNFSSSAAANRLFNCGFYTSGTITSGNSIVTWMSVDDYINMHTSGTMTDSQDETMLRIERIL